MPEIVIRQARPEDREAVLAFCVNTWDWGDYIEQVWEAWVQNPAGCLLVALDGEQPVGLVHMQMLSASDAWQEGMRVDPTYRKQGIAHRLGTEATAEAMRRGATSVRLLTDQVNTGSIHLVEGMHFRRVGAFAPYNAPQLDSVPRSNASQDHIVLARPEDIDDIITYLDDSNVFPVVGGMYYLGYTGYRISDSLLKEKIQGGAVYLLRRWERLDGLAIAEIRAGKQGQDFFIGYIDGTTESISLIAYQLRQKLPEMQITKIRGHVPDLIMVRDAFSGAEYEWDGHVFYTYERGLT